MRRQERHIRDLESTHARVTSSWREAFTQTIAGMGQVGLQIEANELPRAVGREQQVSIIRVSEDFVYPQEPRKEIASNRPTMMKRKAFEVSRSWVVARDLVAKEKRHPDRARVGTSWLLNDQLIGRETGLSPREGQLETSKAAGVGCVLAVARRHGLLSRARRRIDLPTRSR